MRKSPSSKYLLYLAVVPVYRDACIRHLLEEHGGEVEILAGDRHLDPTVTTGLPEELVGRVKNIALLKRRALLQVGGWRKAIQAEVCVVDLNPRSVTSWTICAIRRLLRRRTLAWGHLHPRAGAQARTAPLRVSLRRLTNGTILYGYDSVVPAQEELPGQPVWVAPNSLYARARLKFDTSKNRRSLLYVGRLEPSKRVELLVDAFAQSDLRSRGYKLDIVGSGSMLGTMQEQVERHDLGDSVRFHGRIDDVNILQGIYSETLISISPGYVGLSLTQSLGFGVPVLYAEDAPHAPEIELKRFGGTRSYLPTTAPALATAMCQWVEELESEPIDGAALAQEIGTYYSAEAMADGLWAALEGKSLEVGPDGWPI
ncbi:glycosyltransferase involved in cell wall biosynthesis [Rhodococcus rhodochrous J38]|nr:glycosyltransferase involved in cell wall biosynthesis [Rhodococcus rhodochrous J38]